MFKVAVDGRGRFGNNLIQYFVIKIFCNYFNNYTYTLNRKELSPKHMILTEIQFFNLLKNHNDIVMNNDIFLKGFFQNLSFLNKHRDFIKTLFKYDVVMNNGVVMNNDVINYQHYKKKLAIKDLVINLSELPNENDLVIHIRLDDFIHQVHNSNILDINYYVTSVIESNLIYKWNKIWIVVDKLISVFDKKYIILLVKKFNEHNITNIKFHQKTFLEDWHFCIKATNFISSNSTFALTAILLSNMKYVIIPNESSWNNVLPLDTIEMCKIVNVKRINKI
jgi:hypothetical protein